MIALRRRIERGLANPWLRPFLIVLLAVLLAFLVLHAAHDGAAGEVGAVCFGVTLALSAILLEVVRLFAPPRLVLLGSGRAPPRYSTLAVASPRVSGPIRIPLRR